MYLVDIMFLVKLFLLVGIGWLSAPANSDNSTVATTSSPIITTSSSSNLTTLTSILVSKGTTVTNKEDCSANNGTCNNVTKPVTPTTKPPAKLDGKWKNDQLQPTYYKFKSNKDRDCYCDLHNRFCDINCCCDKDCSLEVKQVFNFCEDAQYLPAPNSKFCNYMQYIYNNRTLQEDLVQQNSLFCIAKSNLPARYYKQKKKVITNPLHANDVIKNSPEYQWANNRNRWKRNLEFTLENGNNTNRSAAFGDLIYIIRNYTKPQILEIPDSFITSDCVTTKAVHFLKDIKTMCKKSLQQHSSHLFLENYIANMTVLSTIRFLNESLMHYQGCPKNVCIPFSIKQCDMKSCSNITENTKSECTQKMCTNIINSVKYKFFHNGTYGIQRIDLELKLNNMTLPISQINQEYEVVFLWMNQREFNYSDFRSGNPGYRIGKPILYSKLITVTNTTTNSTTNTTTTTKNEFLQRKHDNYIKNFLVLPKNVHGKCVLSSLIYENVDFAYNMLTKCVHGQGFIKKVNTTINETCWLLQNNILGYWSLDIDLKEHKNTTSNNTFGYFGNAQNNNLKDWGHFLFDVLPEELLDDTYGREIGNNKSVCQNISTGIKYNIFYERIEDEQHRISAIYVEFVSINHVHLNILNSNVFTDVVLTSEIVHYDVTGVRNMKYVDAPSLDIRLPYDFFYPFVKVENCGLNIKCTFVSLAFEVIIMILCTRSVII